MNPTIATTTHSSSGRRSFSSSAWSRRMLADLSAGGVRGIRRGYPAGSGLGGWIRDGEEALLQAGAGQAERLREDLAAGEGHVDVAAAGAVHQQRAGLLARTAGGQ